jgi:hypothetical protein
MPMVPEVCFNMSDGSRHRAVAVAIAHPSDQRNGRNRKILGFSGENELIRVGWAKSELSPAVPQVTVEAEVGSRQHFGGEDNLPGVLGEVFDHMKHRLHA